MIQDRLVAVAVVRPISKPEDVVGKVIVGLLLTALVAWLLMLIAGTVTGWGLSYWHTLLSLLAIRMVQIVPSARSWTHKPKGSKP